MADLLTYDFMQRVILAAILVGVTAPMVGGFLVQRRLSLIGDGMGHVALAGVAVGVLTGQQPVLTALLFAVVSAVAIELIRARGRTSGDVALAIMFYGGIALGVVLLSQSTSGVTMTSYLFGAITTTTRSDLAVFATLAVVVLLVTMALRRRLFAVAVDEEYARAVGLPVLAYNIVLGILTAVTVVVSMRVVGLLLISALMIVPNAAAQLLARSNRAMTVLAVTIGLVSALGGVLGSYQWGTPSGGTIVLVAVAIFGVLAVATMAREQLSARHHRYAEPHPHVHGPDCGHEAVEHGDHVDYLHHGHRHAPHDDHYDEHHDEHPDEHLDRPDHPGRLVEEDHSKAVTP